MQAINHESVLTNALALAQRHRNGKHSQAVKPTASTAELRAGFDIDLPKQGRPAKQVINLLNNAARPGLQGNSNANFYGWVMGASSEVGIAADILTSAWGQNAGIYQTAPSAAIAEETASRWLLALLDLPRESTIGFTTGATMASFISLAAARYEVLRRHGWSLHEDGLIGAPSISVYVSAEAHASVLAVLQYLGFGSRNLIRIPTDTQGRMSVTTLATAMESLDGNTPAIVIAQAGHINSGAFDDADKIADLAQLHNAWFHIDGAFGLWARSSANYKSLTTGIDRADSWAVDGHKWLQVPYDSGYAIVRDGTAHRHAMSISASYLNRKDDDGRNPSEYGPELSRRARGFTTWAVLQSLGAEGVGNMIDRHCTCAKHLAMQVSAIDGITVLNDVDLNQVAITFDDGYNLPSSQIANADTTNAVISHIQKQNRCFVSGADWQGYRIMRVSVISDQTGPENIKLLVAAIREAWSAVLAQRSEYMALAQCG